MHLKQIALAIICCLVPALASAAQYLDHGEHRIHFTTFSSLIIPAEVAAVHDIIRSENRIVLNLSVVKKDQPTAIIASGHVINLLNQRFDLKFDEVNEAEAIYYLASHMALPHDILRFEIEVTLATSDAAPTVVPIKFVRRYDQ